MGEGLKRVCNQTGGLIVTSKGGIVVYDKNGKVKKPKGEVKDGKPTV